MIDQYDDGGWWVDLAAVSDPDRVASTVARVFGLCEEDRPVIDTLAEQLAGLEALLILDNCEHVWRLALTWSSACFEQRRDYAS